MAKSHKPTEEDIKRIQELSPEEFVRQFNICQNNSSSEIEGDYSVVDSAFQLDYLFAFASDEQLIEKTKSDFFENTRNGVKFPILDALNENWHRRKMNRKKFNFTFLEVMPPNFIELAHDIEMDVDWHEYDLGGNNELKNPHLRDNLYRN